MKMRVLLTLSALGIGFTVPAVAQQKDTTDSQLAQQLEASGRESDEGFNKGDAAAIAALFTQDAVLLLEDGPVYGKPAIEKWLEGVFQNARFSNHLTKVDQKVPSLLSKAGNEVCGSANGVLRCRERTTVLCNKLRDTGLRSMSVRGMPGRPAC